MSTDNKAEIPNAALAPLAALVGEWTTQGTHPHIPGKTLHGRCTFEWIFGGAFLLWRSEIVDDERFPNGIGVFGSDDEDGHFFLLYFDERNVSRKYDVAIRNNRLHLGRNTSGFSQRMALTIADDGNKIDSRGEMSRDGGSWEPDLQLTYTRTA